jgi:hypothetical protein
MKPATIEYDLKPFQFIDEMHPKTQLFLHHTAGNSNPYRVVDGWNSNPERIATPFVIGGKPPVGGNWHDGDIIQCYDEKKYSFHLGLEQTLFASAGIPYKSLDKISIGIEMCNFGWLTKMPDGTFETYVHSKVDLSEVTELAMPYRGFKFWHKYTDAQIESLRLLILHLSQIYSIVKTYYQDIWDICPRALRGENGIFTHNSVRRDKTDIYPDPRIINMLKNL